MEVASKIKELAELALKELDVLQGEDAGHFIVDVLYNSRQRPAKLMVIVDGDHGVTIDVCAELSRKLTNMMDEQNVLADAYIIDVSTPGLDHPLKMKRQYYKNVGREVKAHLTDKTIVQGKLEQVSDSALTILVVPEKKELQLLRKQSGNNDLKGVSTEVPFDSIERVFVMVSFKHN